VRSKQENPGGDKEVGGAGGGNKKCGPCLKSLVGVGGGGGGETAVRGFVHPCCSGL